MSYIIRTLLPPVPAERFIDRLNARKVSRLLRAAADSYAASGMLSVSALGADIAAQLKEELSAFRIRLEDLHGADSRFRVPGMATVREIRDPAELCALDWCALFGLVQRGIRLGLCPDPCRRFYQDPKRRRKSACSPACASRLRARAYREKLRKSPRKYRAHLRRQAALMRQRRAAGLA